LRDPGDRLLRRSIGCDEWDFDHLPVNGQPGSIGSVRKLPKPRDLVQRFFMPAGLRRTMMDRILAPQQKERSSMNVWPKKVKLQQEPAIIPHGQKN